MIFLLSETGLHAKGLAAAADSAGLRTKKTCFGVLLEGEAVAVRQLIKALKKSYGGSIYAKRRGFSIEDTEVCSSTFRFDKSENPWLPRYTEQIRRYTS